MIVVRDLQSAQQISHPQIRELVQQRITDLVGGDIGAWEFGFFLIVEPGDTLDALTEQLGFDILCNRFDGIRYDQPGFTPSFELIEEFPFCYDIVFVLSDDGYGVEIFIEKVAGIDPDLLGMCQRHALQEAPP